MNKREMMKEVIFNRKKYRIPSGANYQLRPLNAIYISPSNSPAHELAKLIICYQLRKWGDFKITEDIKKLILSLNKEVKKPFKGFVKQKSSFITEAVCKQFPDKRRDIVKLNEVYPLTIEIETDKKRAERFKEDPEKEHLIVAHI